MGRVGQREGGANAEASTFARPSNPPPHPTQGGKAVVELGGSKILIAKDGDKLYASSNRCPHLGECGESDGESTAAVICVFVSHLILLTHHLSFPGLPLQGRTALLQADVKAGCVTCSAHGTVFSLTDGAVQGEWCPKLPNLPIVGKGPKAAPLPVFAARLGAGGAVEVDV